MKLKLYLVFALLVMAFNTNAQDIIYWSGSSVNGAWDWGNGCSSAAGGNWWWTTSGTGARQRPDCYSSSNIIKFDNAANPAMNLNSESDYSVNQIQFITGTKDRTISSDAGRRIVFKNNNGSCKIENNVAITTHTFNVPIFVDYGGNNMEINPVNGFLKFTNTINNNSNNPINIYGAQQVTFSGDITGNQGVTINNTATVVYSVVSKTYTGSTTINSGTTLKISFDQTLGNIVLNGGTLIIDSGRTLTVTGTYTATGGTINNSGTIKFIGGSVIFPGSATVNNGAANSMASFEAASTGTVTLNALLNITNTITVSSGILLLGGNDLRLNNAVLYIAGGATFDNGGENQIINGGGSSTITISGIFITRDGQGFVGTGSAIPSVIPILNSGSTVEYGLNGEQAVQGLTAPAYNNVTFSGSGTKTLISGNPITGTITVAGSAVFDASNFTFGDIENDVTMTGSSIYKLGGSGTKPTASGKYSLGANTTFDFTGTSATDIRLSAPTITYANIIIRGTNVSNSGTATGIKFQTGGTFVVKSGATFKLNTKAGFSGAINTAISTTNGGPLITLDAGSTIEYSGASQTISLFTSHYKNLTISGTGIKTVGHPYNTYLDENLNVNASTLLIDTGEIITVNKSVKVLSPSVFEIKNTGQLIQIDDVVINSGAITYNRSNTSVLNTDYTYWSSPVLNQTIGVFAPKTLLGKYYSYDSSIEDWKQELTTTTMTAGIGYIIRGRETNDSSTLQSSSYIFNGIPNNGKYNITGVAINKFYLIGNPYPSAVDADTFLTTNSGVLNGTIYFWTHKTQIGIGVSNPGTGFYAYSQDDYASYNLTGGTGIDGTYLKGGTVALSGGTKPNGKIVAGQGFFASSKEFSISVPEEIVFTNSMRLISNLSIDNTLFFKLGKTKAITSNVIEKNRIWLNLTNSQGAFKQTLLGYITGATNEYDNAFDGESFDGQEFLDFYTVNQDKNLVIQGRALPFDETDLVPLGFRSTIEGAFTIAIDQTDGFMANQAVFLEDKLTNTVFDLKDSNYNFTTVAGTFNDRFILRFINKTLGVSLVETLEKQVLISNKNKQIKINSQFESIDKVLVYDLFGRKIYQKTNVNSNELSILNLASSQHAFLVKVTLQNGKTVTKKIIY